MDMSLHLTYDFPPIGNLSYLPPVSLFINYSDTTKTMAQKDEDNILRGLEQDGFVRRVVLHAPSSSLNIWLELMNKPFPKLGQLSLLSTGTTTEDMTPVIPKTLQAPGLRRLSLHGIGLPKGLPLLSSTIALSTLFLTGIRASCYFSPGDLVIQLQGLAHLEELTIGFATPIPLPSRERELLPRPIPPVTLPTLRRFTFRGLSVYLDNLVAQIDAPLLERLNLTLLFEVAFTLGNLTEFIRGTEGLGCLVAQVKFNKDGVHMDAGHKNWGSYEWDITKLSLQVNCEPLDWQIDAATLVCSALGTVVSNIEELGLDLEEGGMPSDWGKRLDKTLWQELLWPFIGMKKLHIGESLTLELSIALEGLEWVEGLILQELQELEVTLQNDRATSALTKFFETREAMGRPVRLLTYSWFFPWDNSKERVRANLFQITLAERRSQRVRDLENQRKFEEAIKEREMWKARALALEELLMGLPVDISLFESFLKRKVPT
jgi:hypothetical protein